MNFFVPGETLAPFTTGHSEVAVAQAVDVSPDLERRSKI